MIPAWLALAGLCVAFWRALIDAAKRMDGFETAAPLALILAIGAAPVAHRLYRGQSLYRVPAKPLAALLAVYSLAAAFAPGLIAIAIAVLGLLYTLHTCASGTAPPAALGVLGLLATPLLPSLEFYAAYPLREASAWISVGLLQAQGINAVQNGVSLTVGAQSFVFDAPCSGVRMLWASCALVAALAYLHRYRVGFLFLALGLAAAFAVIGNGVRAASLVYLESGALTRLPTIPTHEQVGLAAFALTAATLMGALHWLERRGI